MSANVTRAPVDRFRVTVPSSDAALTFVLTESVTGAELPMAAFPAASRAITSTEGTMSAFRTPLLGPVTNPSATGGPYALKVSEESAASPALVTTRRRSRLGALTVIPEKVAVPATAFTETVPPSEAADGLTAAWMVTAFVAVGTVFPNPSSTRTVSCCIEDPTATVAGTVTKSSAAAAPAVTVNGALIACDREGAVAFRL